MASLLQQQLPYKQLDELYTLLRACDDERCSKQKAIDIIAGLDPEVLYGFMQQLAHAAPVMLHVSGASGPTHHIMDEPPDSPTRHAVDQQLSTLPSRKADSSINSSPQDVQQPPDSAPQLVPATEPLGQVQQQPAGSGRCFLAESLDLNLGASYDWLAKASLADFSSAAAAARLSTTGLVRQSHMRVLSPVAEASYMSAPADAQQEHSEDGSATCETSGLLQAPHSHGVYGSQGRPGHQQGQQPYECQQPTPQQLPQCSTGVSATAGTCTGTNAVHITCSSPTESAGGTPSRCLAPADGMRKSAAESAYGWPNSQPLPFLACEADAEDAAAAPHAQVGVQPTADKMGQDITPVKPGLAVWQQGQQQQQHRSPGIRGGAATSSNSGSSSAPSKRIGGPIKQVLRAPISMANALRRSITGLTGNKGAKGPAASPAPDNSKLRSLACASAPIAAVYGGAGSSKGPGNRQQSSSPGLQVQRTLPSFTANKQPGGSPSKATSAAAAAAACARKAATAYTGSSSSSSSAQRMGTSTGYRPPAASAARGSAAAGSLASGRSPLAKDASAAAGTTGRFDTASHPPSAAARGCGAAPHGRLASQAQQQQHTSPMHVQDRPSSQASVMSYSRSERSLAATGSHTSGGGALPTFDTTRQMLQAGSAQKPQAGRHQQSRLHKPGAGAAAAPQQRAISQQAAAGSSRIPQQAVGSDSMVQQGVVQTGGSKAAAPEARLTRQLQQQQQALQQLQRGVGMTRQAGAITGRVHQHPSGTAVGPQGPGGGGSSSSTKSRIGAGSQLRRSRSCGSLSELVNVADVRQMWQQREAELQAEQHAAVSGGRRGPSQPGSSAGSAPAANNALQAPSSVTRATARQLPAAGAFSRQLHTVWGPAGPAAVVQAATAAGEVLEADPELPLLGRCQSPARCPEQSQGPVHHGRGASFVLAQMGDVIGNVEALLSEAPAQQAATTTAAAVAAAQGGMGSNMLGHPAGPYTRQVPHGVEPTAGPSCPQHSPHALVKKLLAGGASSTATAPGSMAGTGGGGMGRGMQQLLLTPLPKLPGMPAGVQPAAVQAAGGVRGGARLSSGASAVGSDAMEADLNPVSSPDVSPAASATSSQVSHGTGALPRWNVHSAAAGSRGTLSSQEESVFSSQEGPISRQLF